VIPLISLIHQLYSSVMRNAIKRIFHTSRQKELLLMQSSPIHFSLLNSVTIVFKWILERTRPTDEKYVYYNKANTIRNTEFQLNFVPADNGPNLSRTIAGVPLGLTILKIDEDPPIASPFCKQAS
jgi:hypothetical protein